jgi:hypothetical protein
MMVFMLGSIIIGAVIFVLVAALQMSAFSQPGARQLGRCGELRALYRSYS